MRKEESSHPTAILRPSVGDNFAQAIPISVSFSPRFETDEATVQQVESNIDGDRGSATLSADWLKDPS